MRDLLVILPVRGRPDSARRFMKAFRETATAATDVALITDEDDTSSSGLSGELDVMGMTLVRVPTAQKINKAAEACAGSYEALMFMGDDNVPLTPGWDGFLLDALGGCGMAFANDLSPHAGLLPCSVMMSSAIVRALGWMALPGCSHFFIDNCWREIGQRAGCLTYLPGVVIDHLHPVWGKGQMDELYASARPMYWDHDEAAFHRWVAGRMDADVATVAALREGA